MYHRSEDQRRKLLDSDDDWGLLTSLVLEEHDKEEDPVSSDEAKRRFIAAACPSAVFLLDLVERNPTKERISFTNISVKVEVDGGEQVTVIEGELDVGVPVLGVSPRLWLRYLAARVQELDHGDRFVIEQICNVYVLMQAEKEARNTPPSTYN